MTTAAEKIAAPRLSVAELASALMEELQTILRIAGRSMYGDRDVLALRVLFSGRVACDRCGGPLRPVPWKIAVAVDLVRVTVRCSGGWLTNWPRPQYSRSG